MLTRRVLVLVFLGCLSAEPGFGQQYSFEDIMARAEVAREQLERAGLEGCEPHLEKALVPWYGPNNTEIAEEESFTVTEWTGGCVAGQRDGSGKLSIRIERNLYPPERTVQFDTQEGTLVGGRRVGLWCGASGSRVTKLYDAQSREISSVASSDLQCRVFAANTQHNELGTFRKLEDGSWQENLGVDPYPKLKKIRHPYTLPPGTLETLSDKIIAGFRAGNAQTQASIIIESDVFEGLLSSPRVTFAPSPNPLDLTEKRVAVVLSSRAVSELARFKKERQAYIESTSNVVPTSKADRDELVRLSEPAQFLGGLVTALRKKAKVVSSGGDLSILTRGDADYVLLFDWSYVGLFGLTEAEYASLPASSVPRDANDSTHSYELMQAMLIDRNLNVVRAYSALPLVYWKEPWHPSLPSIAEGPGSGPLPSGLLQAFRWKWGTAGFLFRVDYLMKEIDKRG